MTPQSVPPPQSSAGALVRGIVITLLLAAGFLLWSHEPVPRGVYDAVVSGDIDLVRKRVRDGGEVNWAPTESGFGALHEAVFHGRRDIAELLLAHGADANAQGVYGDAPLHDVRDPVLARMLLDSGARTDLQSNTLGTPLHAAVMHREPALVELIIEYGARVEALDVNDSTPLHHAAGLGDLVSARLLLQHGAPVDAVNGPGYSALHWAAANGREEMVALLLASGANPQVRALDGTSVADAARERGHTALAERIESRPPALMVNP